MSEASLFLKSLFAPYNEGYIELRALGDETFIKTYSLSDSECFKRLVHDASILDSTALYPTITFGVLPRSHQLDGKGAGKKEDVVSQAYTVWVDVDSLYNEKPTHQQLEQDTSRIEDALPEGLTPRAVVCSGHGLHFYFVLDEPLPITTIEQINRTLAEQLKERGISADSQSADAARVMRLPNTTNRKANPPIPCTLVKLTKDITPKETALSLLPRTPRATTPPSPQPTSATHGQVSTTELVERIKPYWTEGNRHAIALGLCAQLKKAGVPLSEARSIIEGVCSELGDDEVKDRLRALEDTYQSEDVAYLTHYKKVLSENEAKQLADSVYYAFNGRTKKQTVGIITGKLSANERFAILKDIYNELVEELFIDEEREAWVVISNTHRSLKRVEELKPYLINEYVSRCGHTPPESNLNMFIEWVKSQAIDTTPRTLHVKVTVRKFKDGSCELWYDMGERMRAIRISPQGWELVEDGPAIFRRMEHHAPQVCPEEVPSDSSELRAILWRLFEFVRVPEEQRLLFIVWLIASLLPDIARPILLTVGEKGSGKSMLAKVVKTLIEPSKLTEPMLIPQDREDLGVVLYQHYIPTFDNVSTFGRDVSDMLCAVCTGASIARRKRYTDKGESSLFLKRVVCINGINEPIATPDFLDRVLFIGPLERISEEERGSERLLLAKLERMKPTLLGAIFTTLSKAMSGFEQMLEDGRQIKRLPRLADWFMWAVHIAEALGFSEEDVRKAYHANTAQAITTLTEANPLFTAVKLLMEDKSKWEGTPTELLEVLDEIGEEQKLKTARGWPNDVRVLGRRLNEIKSDLRELGIIIERGKEGRGKERTRKYIITKIGDTPPLLSSDNEGKDDDRGGGGTLEMDDNPDTPSASEGVSESTESCGGWAWTINITDVDEETSEPPTSQDEYVCDACGEPTGYKPAWGPDRRALCPACWLTNHLKGYQDGKHTLEWIVSYIRRNYPTAYKDLMELEERIKRMDKDVIKCRQCIAIERYKKKDAHILCPSRVNPELAKVCVALRRMIGKRYISDIIK